MNLVNQNQIFSSFAFYVEILLPKACKRVLKNQKHQTYAIDSDTDAEALLFHKKKVCKEALAYGKSVYKSIKLESNSNPLVECVSRGLCCAGAHYKSK